MAEEPTPTPSPGNKTTVYLLGVIVVLLVAIVAIIIISQQNKPGTAVDQTASPGSSTSATSTGSMPGVGQSTGAAFDAATATKVPSGEKPDAYVKRYYQAILDKKWDVAFKMQPATSQQGGAVEDFQQTQTSYGMTAFKVLSANEQGDAATVDVEQDLGANGMWSVIWSFAKYKDGWVVQSRKVQMKP
jgi:hypothetical protein